MRPPIKPGPKSFKNKTSSLRKSPRRPATDLGDSDTSSEVDQVLERVDQRTHSHLRTNISKGQRSHGNDLAQHSGRNFQSMGESSQIDPIQRPMTVKLVKRNRKGVPNRNFVKSYKLLVNRVDFMIPRASFSRIVREILMSLDTNVQYITQTAFEALQTATEAYIEGRLEDANLLALHARRVTLMVRDLQLINYLRCRER
ncbi:histone H3.3 type b-like [Bactrocera neohumeralis]|uniref:histone H3.3 type b-like n=1 Tax=Bactrocera tryoni TaxID=59916 RepID=UPI001A987424|nr:histone H3.3 type b-like [Bactrocera tryoni]XP_050330990.1 histone H3.3 type b-like [Bactrocera neohumeralis]